MHDGLLDLGWCTANLNCGNATENKLNDDEFAEPDHERRDGMTRNSEYCSKTQATVKMGTLKTGGGAHVILRKQA